MINLTLADATDNALRPRIAVMGVGGAGGNAINNMIRSQLEGCDFIAANTDAQALQSSLAPRKIQLGMTQTRGLGAGSRPETGRGAAEEQMADIMACLTGSDMVFITAGMGGGTGTGAAPVIAKAAREAGILTVGVVTKPFQFEGTRRMQQADSGIAELQQYVDTLIVIPNQNLFRLANERTTFAEAFRMADEVLHSGVRGITDLMVMPGFMNLDFADVKTVMAEMGKAMMGTGEAEGDNRALRAAEAAISNPLLDDVSLNGARGVLINITGGMDMTLFEVDQAANRIREEVDRDAQIKVGSTLSDDLEGRIRVSVIATGIDAGTAVIATNRSAGGYAATPAQQAASLRVVADQQAKKQTYKTTVQVPSTPAPVVPTSGPVSISMSATPRGATTATSPVTAAATSEAKATPLNAFAAPAQAMEENLSQLMQADAPAAEAPSQMDMLASASGPTPDYSTADQRTETTAPARQSTPMMRPAQMPQTPAERATMPATDAPKYTSIAASAPVPPSTLGESGSKRAESLFRRITGFGQVRGQQAEQQAPVRQPTPTAQARLGIDQTPDKSKLSPADDDDTLDIPAFLRRQTSH